MFSLYLAMSVGREGGSADDADDDAQFSLEHLSLEHLRHLRHLRPWCLFRNRLERCVPSGYTLNLSDDDALVR